MNWQRRAAEWIEGHQTAVNIALVLFFAIGGSIAATFVPLEGSERAVDWLAYLLISAAAIAVWWRRSRPLFALPVAAVWVAIYWVLDYPGGIDPLLLLLFYAATLHGGSDRQRVWQVVTVCFVALMTVATVGVIVSIEDLPILAAVGIAVIHGAAAAVGEARYQRAKYIEELEQRAAMLEADLENKAALAAVEERTRIAREMHDIIAHGMSTVVVQAQAGQSVVDSNPAKAREVLHTIERIGRDSVDEMRRMLGVLRDGTGEVELEPQPKFEDLDNLRRDIAAAGVDVVITVHGDDRLLPPGLELTGYRVVQEALTNVVRHAGRPAQAEVHIGFHDRSLEISVHDDGLGAAASSATAGSGHGLLGMRERVEIYNGTFHAGPRAGGGYAVKVSLPIPAQVAA